jgi:transcriptional repressor NrdR
MRCPNCASLDTQVKDSRPTEDSAAIRRRRVCLACNFRFTTFEQMVSKIVRDLESLGESEVSSEAIGETVMEHLRGLDDVAYVRFASVYRNFREPKDFQAVLGELSADEQVRAPAHGHK